MTYVSCVIWPSLCIIINPILHWLKVKWSTQILAGWIYNSHGTWYQNVKGLSRFHSITALNVCVEDFYTFFKFHRFPFNAVVIDIWFYTCLLILEGKCISFHWQLGSLFKSSSIKWSSVSLDLYAGNPSLLVDSLHKGPVMEEVCPSKGATWMALGMVCPLPVRLIWSTVKIALQLSPNNI